MRDTYLSISPLEAAKLAKMGTRYLANALRWDCRLRYRRLKFMVNSRYHMVRLLVIRPLERSTNCVQKVVDPDYVW
jgi:hypothetical protein